MNDDRRAQRIHTCGETFGVAYTVVSSAIFHHFSTTYIDRLLCLVKWDNSDDYLLGLYGGERKTNIEEENVNHHRCSLYIAFHSVSNIRTALSVGNEEFFIPPFQARRLDLKSGPIRYFNVHTYKRHAVNNLNAKEWRGLQAERGQHPAAKNQYSSCNCHLHPQASRQPQSKTSQLEAATASQLQYKASWLLVAGCFKSPLAGSLHMKCK